MQYFQNASASVSSVVNHLIVPLRETRRQGVVDDTYFIKLTCDISKVTKEFFTLLSSDTHRFSKLEFTLVNDIANEDLINGLVFFEPTGSYTWIVESRTDNFTHAKGKAIIYPHGVFNTKTKFGNEVTYTEHDNPTTNTIYIRE
tara:strand:+ start:66 stop:497 length:432 start_codon:yes stop_codon:yes gene_type:complete